MKTLLILILSTVGLFAGEVTNEVKAVRVRMMCDCSTCGGEMKPTNVVLTSNPPQYPHNCDKCGATRTYWVVYPFIKYIDAHDKPATITLPGYTPYWPTNTLWITNAVFGVLTNVDTLPYNFK